MRLASVQTAPCTLPHPTVISNGAGRRLLFRVRSCERVGLRREKSLFVLGVQPLREKF